MDISNMESGGISYQFIQARNDACLSQRQLAEIIGMYQAELSKIERGVGNPSLQTLEKIANALGKTLQIKLIDRSSLIYKDTGIKQIVIDELIQLAEECDITTLVLFGSRARGDFNKRSDVDLAIAGGEQNLFSFNIEEKTSTLLMFDKVNLDSDLDDELRANIRRDGIVLYEKI